MVDGCDITEDIRTPPISGLASVVAAIPAVREWLLPVQRGVASVGRLVAEGRDLGTKVFPEAQVKFFLDADMEVRAARRHEELATAGHRVGLAQTEEELRARDARDRGRTTAPLARAADAIVIDTTALDVDQVIERMMAVVSARL
jgi:cytidylate kinase